MAAAPQAFWSPAPTVDAEAFNRLLDIADEKAASGYTKDGGCRRGDAATKARQDLDALQCAIAHLKSEGRLWGFDGPVNLRKRTAA